MPTGERLLPIAVGISAQRDLPPALAPALQQRIREVLEWIRRECPLSPLVFMSPLAEGAEQLGAQAALALGCELVVPLPVPAAEYEREFSDDTARQAFRALLARASRHYVLPPAPGSGGTREQRKVQQVQLGRHIAEVSLVLVAAWDGTFDDPPGSTADVVMHALRADARLPSTRLSLRKAKPRPKAFYVTTVAWLDVGHSTGSGTIEVPAPRLLRPMTSDQLAARATPGYAAPDQAPWQLREIERFNASATERAPAPPVAPLLPDPELAALPADLRRVHGVYVVAEDLAQYFQRRTLWIIHAIYFTGLAMAFSVCVQTLGPSGLRTAAQGVYTAGLLAVFAFGYLSQRLGFQELYWDYRTLAEGLRVQFFLSLVTTGERAGARVHDIWHYCLRHHRALFGWILAAIRTVAPATDANTEPQPDPRALEWVRRHWIEDQVRYFSGTAQRLGARAALLGKASTLLLFPGLVLGFVNLGLKAAAHGPLASLQLLTATATALAAAGALLASYSNILGLKENSRRYANMAELFEEKLEALDEAVAQGLDPHEPVYDLVRETLQESAGWYSLHRSRPVRLRQV